jgi:hypothetical protein
MKTIVAAALLTAVAVAMPASAKKNADGTPIINAGELVLYEFPNYNGRSYLIKKTRPLVKTEWNVASIAVHPGDSWQVCEKARYKDPCMVLTSGEANLGRITIGSARPSSEID